MAADDCTGLLRAPLSRLWRWPARAIALRVKSLSIRDGRRFLGCFFRTTVFDAGPDPVHVEGTCAVLRTLGLLVRLCTSDHEPLSVFRSLLCLEMLLRESGRQDETLPCLRLPERLRSYRESFQISFVLLFLCYLFLEFPWRRDARWHRLSREFHRRLLRTPGARATNLHSSSKHRPAMDLVELRLITARVRINIVSEQELTVHRATVSWLRVAITICVESWLAEVSRERGVWQPPRALLQLFHFIIELLPLFVIQFQSLLCRYTLLFSDHCFFVGTCLLR